MQFKVPQFLDIEDKIFGPFTFSQFVYLAGGAGLCFVLYKLLGIWFGIIPMLLVAGFALALTFYRPNNKPFINMLEAGTKYLLQDRLYIWKRKKIRPDAFLTGGKVPEGKVEMLNAAGAQLSGSKLRDLAWSLDVLDLKEKSNQNLGDK